MGGPRQLCHRGERQVGNAHAQRVVTSEFAEDAPQGMRRGEAVVAVGDHQQAARALNAPTHVTHEIEGSLVGPVQVLEHYDRDMIRPGQLIDQAREQLRARVFDTLRRMLGVNTRHRQSGRDFMDGPKRSRCLQRIASAPDHANSAPGFVRERLDQCALARAGFTRHEDDLASSSLGFLQLPARSSSWDWRSSSSRAFLLASKGRVLRSSGC